MTSILDSRRQAWDTIFSDPNLSRNSLGHRAAVGTVCQSGLRSVCWKAFLSYFESLDTSLWASTQAKQRRRYTDLRWRYIVEPAQRMTEKSADEDLTDNNPLALNDNNPWQQYFADVEIRKVIRQDVDRTFPDVDYFRSEQVQEQMTDILFIYCKINSDVSYRQGMHELLAPLYWVIAHDSLPPDVFQEEQATVDPTNKLLIQVLDPSFIEHDTFILFDEMMKYAKPWYEFNETISSIAALNPKHGLGNGSKLAPQTRINPVVLSCQKMHHQYLREADPALYSHLEQFGIEPQLYGMRWFRLLFGREFEFHELLRLWDAIFAQDPTLKIVEYVGLALLMRMHDKLISGDYAECLSLLMKGSHVSRPASLVEQAKYLQSDLSEAGGLQILQQNDLQAGKPPRHSVWDGVRRPDVRLENKRIAHRRSQGANLDGLATLTRGVMKSPQVRDLNKAIAGVMDTVQKNVNMFGDNVMGRSGQTEGTASRRRQTVSAEFPEGVANHSPPRGWADIRRSNFSAVARQSENQTRRTEKDGALAALQATNRKMGNVLSKYIEVLESKFFPAEEEPTQADTLVENGQGSPKLDKRPSSAQDDASLIAVLAGLKHMRDVLIEKQTHFDPVVVEAPFIKGEATKPAVNGWEVVDHDEVQPKRLSAKLDFEKDKPLPPLKNDQPQRPSQPVYTPITQAPPKQHVVYRIEDLLSDPTLQEGGERKTKFEWLEKDGPLPENVKPTGGSRVRQRPLMREEAKPVGTASLVDPLDAKNVDKRKIYENDVF